ncbi:MAG: hypothetical protein R3C05_00690 [Pirellulaceae bacterium]
MSGSTLSGGAATGDAVWWIYTHGGSVTLSGSTLSGNSTARRGGEVATWT